MNILGKFLLKKRLQLNKTQEVVSHETGIQKILISYYENGRRTPHKENLYKLMLSLNIENKELIFLKEDYIEYICQNINDFNLLELARVSKQLTQLT